MITNVAIVEDNAGICNELQHVISGVEDFKCVCVCRNGESALAKIPGAKPDVVIMDIQLPDRTGIECTAKLKRILPGTQFLMFTIYDEGEHIFKALEAGAVGYILKSSPPEEIIRAVRQAKNGGAPMSAEIGRKVVESFHHGPPSPQENELLTPREDEILALLAKGLLGKEIANHLGISHETVGSHLKNIYRKLGVTSRTQATIKFFQRKS